MRHKLLQLLIISLTGLLPTLLYGNNIEVNSSVSSTKIGLEDAFNYTISVESTGKEELKVDIKLIEFAADLHGPNISNAFSSSFNNGRFSSSRTQTHTYTAYARKEGTLTLPQIEVIVNGKKFFTQVHKIEVVAGTLRQQRQTRQQTRSPFDSFFDRGYEAPPRNQNKSFIEVEMSRDSVYVGQEIIAKYTLYATSNQYNIRAEIEPYEGYGTVSREIPDAEWVRVKARGGQYLMREIGIIVITAQQAGMLTLPKMSVVEDNFFNKIVTNSPEKKLLAKELPQKGKAIDFSNAIGTFTIKSELNQNTMFDNQQNQLIVTIRGRGNFKNILYPQIHQVDGLEILKPKAVLDTAKEDDSRLVLTYDIIPSASGKFKIPVVNFNYFDDKLEKYQTIYSCSHLLTVKTVSAAESITNANNQEIFFSRNRLYLGTINHEYLITNKATYWVLLNLFILTMTGYLLYYKQQKKLMGNIGFVRRKEGLLILKKSIDESQSLVQNNDSSFYTKAQNNLLKFISITTKASLQLSQQELIKELKNSSVHKVTVEKINSFLTYCEQIKYRPNFETKENITKDFQKYQDIYHEIKNS